MQKFIDTNKIKISSNDFIKNLIVFFDEYNIEITKILTENPENLNENIVFLQQEKRRLIQLAKIYEHILKLNITN